MNRELQNFRGVACVTRAGELVFTCVQGYADLVNERVNRLDTRFPIASGSKGFVAMGILRLIEESRLSLNTRLADAVDFDLHAIDPEVTVEQLLTHTSGVPDYFDESVMENYNELWTDFPCYRIRKSSDLLPLFIDKPMMYPRGARFQYNNTGFVLLGLVIEGVTGMTFDQYLQTALFEPCGMCSTGYFEMGSSPQKLRECLHVGQRARRAVQQHLCRGYQGHRGGRGVYYGGGHGRLLARAVRGQRHLPGNVGCGGAVARRSRRGALWIRAVAVGVRW